ncbi:ADP compounds hydrolase NudE [hydrothermal vent metagenome]|uniref:ADP compounds hydrolase NudE n=1 Tax=hydrothermal vent metagenome TaxID=652676 RepID=A0A3B0ZGX6_9ZZZZ
MLKKPQILNVKTVAETRLFKVEALDLEFSNGVFVQYERLKTSSYGAVLAVPMIDDETVLLIREYAAGVDRYELALPKGRIEAGEGVLDAASREMMEEVGYGARQLTLLKTLTSAPGYSSQQTHIVLAEALYEQRLPGDEPEEIEVVRWPVSKLDELFRRDDCTEARSIAALYMVRDLLAKRAEEL